MDQSPRSPNKTPRQRFDTRLRRGIQVLIAAACIAPGYLDSAAQAQLRTGREGSREYYPQATTAEIPRPTTNPMGQSKSTRATRPITSVKSRELESLASDPPSVDLPRLVRSDESESLPRVLASNAKTSRPVVTEVLPADFVTPSRTGTASNRAVGLASHQVVARQPSANTSNVIKRLTPSRVVSDRPLTADPPVHGGVIDPIEPQVSSYPNTMHEHSELEHSEGYLVDDPMGTSEYYGACQDPNCSECGPGYPTLNIRIGFPPLLRCDRLTARVEAATFWPTAQALPPLVRTAEIGVPGSRDLFGDTVNLDQSVQGIRGEFGWRFGMAHCNTLQFRFFDAGAQSLTFDSPKTTETSIVRPYQDASQTPIVQDAVSIKEPGISDGSVLAHAFSDVQGGDILLRRLWLKNCDSTTEWLAGYQNARLTDSIDVHSTTVPIGSANKLELRDQFRAVNQFHGATIGLSRMVYSPRWSLGSMFKLGLGDMQRDVTIAGFQKVGNAPATNNGLLARSPASGFYSTNAFVFTPEVNVTLGYRLTQNLEATLGYTYLGLPKVARAGEQIDTVSDLENANATRPRFTLQESNFSLHSLNYGLQYRY